MAMVELAEAPLRRRPAAAHSSYLQQQQQKVFYTSAVIGRPLAADCCRGCLLVLLLSSSSSSSSLLLLFPLQRQSERATNSVTITSTTVNILRRRALATSTDRWIGGISTRQRKTHTHTHVYVCRAEGDDRHYRRCRWCCYQPHCFCFFLPATDRSR